MNLFILLPQSYILLLATDSLTNVQVLHTLLLHQPNKSKFLLLVRECTLALVCMFALFMAAEGMLSILQTPACAAQVAGGVGVTLGGIRAVLRKTNQENWTTYRNGRFSLIAPIALPLIIGPSWLSAVCAMISHGYTITNAWKVLIVTWSMITFLTLFLQAILSGEKAAKLALTLQTVLGFFTTIVGSQLLMSGLQKTFL